MVEYPSGRVSILMYDQNGGAAYSRAVGFAPRRIKQEAYMQETLKDDLVRSYVKSQAFYEK